MNIHVCLLTACVLALAACGGPESNEKPPLPEYPGELVDTAAMGDDFMMRQRVTFMRGETESSMLAVVQKQGSELILLGLTPFGSRAFMIRQQGVNFEVQSFVPQPFPVPPRFVLLDVHRVNFMHAGEGTADGVRTAERAGERIEERWRDGALRERRFLREGYEAPIVVDFGSDSEVSLRNGWLRYQLKIETLERTSL